MNQAPPRLPPPPLPIGPGAIHVALAPDQPPTPMSGIDLRGKIAAGQVPLDANIWYAGLADWIRAGDHPELAREGVASVKRADEELDLVFGELVRGSWKYFHAHDTADHIDEVFVGALITSTLDNGYSLIDITSDGSNHYLRFENLGNGTRIVFSVNHLARDLIAARVLGQMASVVIGYGERVQDPDRVWQALKAEYKSGYLQSPEPGTVTVDADMAAGYVYVQVDLYWNIGEYVSDKLEIDYPKLTSHVGATVNALRKYLVGRFR